MSKKIKNKLEFFFKKQKNKIAQQDRNYTKYFFYLLTF